MSDLTAAQNARIRAAMWAWLRAKKPGERRNLSALAEAVGIKQPSLSRFLNHAHNGCSLQTARLFAENVLRQPVDEVMGAPDAANAGGRPSPRDPLDIDAYDFYWRSGRRLELGATVILHPGRWRLRTVISALLADYEEASDGSPATGWEPLLDRLQGVNGTPAEGTAASEAPRSQPRSHVKAYPGKSRAAMPRNASHREREGRNS